jgi:hypothetical protein
MPVISRFYGIAIKMYFRDHGVPHFHARYAEFDGVFAIDSLEMIEGDLPGRAKKLVIEWGHIHRDDLRSMWESQEFRVLPGLDA